MAVRGGVNLRGIYRKCHGQQLGLRQRRSEETRAMDEVAFPPSVRAWKIANPAGGKGNKEANRRRGNRHANSERKG